MKNELKPLLPVAVFYAAVVAVTDFFLAERPAIRPIALGLTFLFFIALILDSVARLREKEMRSPLKTHETREDELGRLERIVKGALIEHESEYLKMLDARIGAAILTASARCTGGPEPGQRADVALQAVAGNGQTPRAPATSMAILNSSSIKDVESMLAKIERGLE